jgi:cell division septal protein FtsQ
MTKRKLIGAAIMVLAIAMFVVVGYFAVKYALPERTFTLKGVRRITVVGNYLVPSSELLSLAGLDSPSASEKLRPAVVEKELAAHRLIRSAKLARRGNTVVLWVAEVRPYFRTIMGGKKYWLCRDGELIPMDAEADFGHPYDALRQCVSLRLAGMQLLEDPAMVSLILYTAMRLEDMLPHSFAEMRVDLRGNIQLVTRSGLVAKIGDTEALNEKLADLPHVVRMARNTPNAVLAEYLDENHWVLKIVRR